MKKFICLFFCLSTFSLSALDWNAFKNDAVWKATNIQGWCSQEKASLIMDLIREKKFRICVEIGVFAGASLLPMAKALEFNGSGMVFGIDAWDPNESIKGFKPNDANYQWWGGLDYNSYYTHATNLFEKTSLKYYTNLIKQPSEKALRFFPDESIDFIHFDGNHNEEYAYQDVSSYFPKVKDGGYILLTDPNWFCMRKTLIFLMERADTITPFVRTATFILFRKTNQRIENAEALLKQE